MKKKDLIRTLSVFKIMEFAIKFAAIYEDLGYENQPPIGYTQEIYSEKIRKKFDVLVNTQSFRYKNKTEDKVKITIIFRIKTKSLDVDKKKIMEECYEYLVTSPLEKLTDDTMFTVHPEAHFKDPMTSY